jgi:hypothetical protein
MLRTILSTRAVHCAGALVAVVAAILCVVSTAHAKVILRTCEHNGYERVKVAHRLTCSQGNEIGNKALSTDGPDGARFRAYGRAWQCSIMLRPHHHQWTLFGCFSPYAPSNLDQPYYRHLALVTVLVHVAGDVMTPASSSDFRRVAATPLVYSGRAVGHGAFQRRPATIIYSGDGSALLAGGSSIRSHLVWTSYTRQGARATGADWFDNCEPDCADGTYHAYFAKVHLYRPERIDGYRAFTRMTVHLLSAGLPFPNAPRFVVFHLRYEAEYGSIFWNTQ